MTQFWKMDSIKKCQVGYHLFSVKTQEVQELLKYVRLYSFFSGKNVTSCFMKKFCCHDSVCLKFHWSHCAEISLVSLCMAFSGTKVHFSCCQSSWGNLQLWLVTGNQTQGEFFMFSNLGYSSDRCFIPCLS